MDLNNQFVWALYFGASVFEAIRWPKGHKKLAIDDIVTFHERYGHYDLLADDDPTGSAFSTFVSEHKINDSDTVAVCLPADTGFARFLRLPPLTDSEIAEVMANEAVAEIPFGEQNSIWTYQTTHKSLNQETEQGLFAAKRKAIQRCLDLLSEFGLKTDLIQIKSMALWNLAFWNTQAHTNSENEFTAIISMATKSTDLIIGNNCSRLWCHRIPIGGADFTEALQKNLKLTSAKAEDLKRGAVSAADPKTVFQAMRPIYGKLADGLEEALLQFLKAYEHKSANIKMVFLSGGPARLPGVKNFLIGHLNGVLSGAPICLIETIFNEKCDERDPYQKDFPSFAACYGTAIQVAGYGAINTNLMP